MTGGGPLLHRLQPHPRGAWIVLAEADDAHLVAARAGEPGLVSLRREGRGLDDAAWRFLTAPGHPAIPPVVARDDGWAATPLTIGTTLDAVLRAPGRVPVEVAAHLSLSLCAAFERIAAHLPEWSPDPARVLVDLDGAPRVIIEPEHLSPGPQAVLFDPRLRWCTPEQVRGAARDHADAWYYAIVLHDLLHGAPLFDEDSVQGLARLATVESGEVAAAHLEDERAARLVREGLALLPEQRASGRSLARALREISAGTHDDDVRALVDALFPERAEARDLVEELRILA